jgi:hypothetical protein
MATNDSQLLRRRYESNSWGEGYLSFPSPKAQAEPDHLGYIRTVWDFDVLPTVMVTYAGV